MLERFSAAIGGLYAAAADAGRWGDALAELEQVTGSAGAVVHLIPKSDSRSFETLLGNSAEGLFLADHVQEWTENYAPICPRIAGAARFPGARFLVDHMLLTEAEMDADPVYDWYGQYGLRYFVGCALFQTPEIQVVWSLQRTRCQGHAQGDDIRLFELLTPHLSRALQLAEQLGSLRSGERFGSAMLEALPQAVFALDRSGLVLFANGAGRCLLARDDGLSIAGGRLRAALSSEQSRLDAMLCTALVPLGASTSGWTRVSRSSGGPPLAVFVAPLNVDDDQLTAVGAKALVVVHDTANHHCAGVEMLTSIYGLTETEARLASALSGGHSIQSAANLLHMRPATARSHLKAVFRKMGVSRQQDLVRVLTSLASLSTSTAEGSD